MGDDKSLDVFGTKPLAKAVEKATERSIDGLGSFLSALFMPAAEELGLLIRDRISSFRIRNLISIVEKTKKRLEKAENSPSGKASPRLLHEIVEVASWAEDNEIQKMWAGLLVDAASRTSSGDDALVYTEALRRITPFQARFLNMVYGDPRACDVSPPVQMHEEYYTPHRALIYDNRAILECFPGDLTEVVPISGVSHEDILSDEKNHVIAVSRFRPQLQGLVSMDLFYQIRPVNGGREGFHVFPSWNGLDLYMRCLGYSIYPVEAFLVTQQHWASLQRAASPNE